MENIHIEVFQLKSLHPCNLNSLDTVVKCSPCCIFSENFQKQKWNCSILGPYLESAWTMLQNEYKHAYVWSNGSWDSLWYVHKTGYLFSIDVCTLNLKSINSGYASWNPHIPMKFIVILSQDGNSCSSLNPHTPVKLTAIYISPWYVNLKHNSVLKLSHVLQIYQ